MSRFQHALRWVLVAALVGAIAIVALAAIAYRSARADPVVRRATIALPGWPHGAKAVTVALLSDIHIGNATMDSARLNRIVTQVDALHPDIVLLAGDFIFGHDPANAARVASELTQPLSRLRAPLGTIAVLGNHDHWTGAREVRRALEAAGVTILENQAVRRGPLAIGGIGDRFTDHDRIAPTGAAMRSMGEHRSRYRMRPTSPPTCQPDFRYCSPDILIAGRVSSSAMRWAPNPMRDAIAAGWCGKTGAPSS